MTNFLRALLKQKLNLRVIVRKKTLTVRPPVLVSLYEVVHLSVGPLELSHSHGVQVVQDQTQAVLGQVDNVGVLVSRGQLRRKGSQSHFNV